MMETPQQKPNSSRSEPHHAIDTKLKAIAYSLDALIPGLYIWCGPIKIRLGGSPPEDTYSGTIHSLLGIALVLPGYKIYSTYQGSYNP
jgi:hypothetical protein